MEKQEKQLKYQNAHDAVEHSILERDWKGRD